MAEHIPLRRTRRVPLEALRRRLEGQASSNGVVPLENYSGVVYSAEMTIGNGTFRVQVDTGSSDLWLSCYYVDRSRCQLTCPSSAVVITYGSGDVCVVREYADVQLGSIAIKDYAVGVAMGANVLPNSDSILLGDVEGLLGLAYPSLVTIPSPVGTFTDFVKSFSTYLTAEDGSDGSFLLLNAVDEDFIKENKLTGLSVPLKKAEHWTLGLTSFQIGDETAVAPCSASGMSSGSCNAIIDSGTSLLIMPADLYQSFAETYLLPNGCFTSEEVASGQVYICDSSINLPRLGFTFSNASFYLEKADYIIEASPTKIIVELQAASTINEAAAQMWVFGDTFLKRFYTNFEVNQGVTFYCNEGKTCATSGSSVTSSTTSSSTTDTSTPSTAPGSTLLDGTFSPSTIGGTSSGDDKSSGLSSLERTLIIVAAVLGGLLLILLFFMLRRWLAVRHQRKAQQQRAMAYNGGETVASTGDAYNIVMSPMAHTNNTR
ncbi:hypothetical protein Poli38472_012281 [Pythium oligandrum]|uniref:Peptidase A1 domain-containing protein n=1 Tax=Pythium oligandrum TaxID=41045 RepID=A0A8K1CPL3_PYTOL|nr:hypothetical protein Poli38472_012281 [Pythium oligandrum]|eukprot:TMW67165.1 hypothetical protein Poli38472_012281 [Pythium oligandrum]